MKRTITLLIATALIFGMSQCKKNVETITPSNLGEAVHITVNVDDGGKHIVYPGTGAYVFENGDKLYVGNNGKYRGTLTYNSGAFSGTIYSPSTDDYLHFYFVGGLTPSATPSAGSTESFTVNIANQSSKLPVLSYAHSTQKYVNGTTTYGCTLLNKCGLVKFNLSTATDKAVTVGGLYTTATINFASAQEGITPEGTTGAVTLRNEGTNNKRWAILLPQAAITDPTVTIAGYDSSITTLPATTNNTYNNTGVNITMNASGTLSGVFTVASGKTVKFSQGNLQYIGSASTPYWKFAEHQYEYLGNNGQGSTSTTANRDLFGWGTSGYNHGATCYQPWSTSTNYNDYNPYGSMTTNLYDGSGSNKGKADWGYNAISNGGNSGNFGWRTLKSEEWVYLFHTRATGNTINGTQNARYTEATINTNATSVNGVILFPDTYTAGTPAGVTWGTINGSSAWGTKCTTAGWNALEAAGCVFLPAAGNRIGSTIYDPGIKGFYLSSSWYSDDQTYSYCVNLSSGNVSVFRFIRYGGGSVRLVFDN